jgi:hypothetical protein
MEDEPLVCQGLTAENGTSGQFNCQIKIQEEKALFL